MLRCLSCEHLLDLRKVDIKGDVCEVGVSWFLLPRGCPVPGAGAGVRPRRSKTLSSPALCLVLHHTWYQLLDCTPQPQGEDWSDWALSSQEQHSVQSLSPKQLSISRDTTQTQFSLQLSFMMTCFRFGCTEIFPLRLLFEMYITTYSF